MNPVIIRWARHRARLSIAELAKRLNISTDQVYAWEYGTSQPTIQQSEKLARALNIPFGYLWLGEPPSDAKIIAQEAETVDTAFYTIIGKQAVEIAALREQNAALTHEVEELREDEK